MQVKVLDHTYLNDRYLARDQHQSSHHQSPLMKRVDLEKFTPIAFSGFGITMIRTLRKVILDEVPVFAVKSSMDLVNYEQTDKNGNSYLHESYSKYYQIQESFDTFQNDSKRQEYLDKSGFAKIVVADEENKRIYNGDEHTQVLTDRLGYLPIDCNLSYFLDAKRSPPVRVPLDQIWFFIGKTSAEQINGIGQIEPIEFKSSAGSRIYHLTVSNSVLAFYYDDLMWHNITSRVVPKYNARGEAETPSGLFPYDTLLLSLKPGQRVLAHCRLEEGCGRKYAKWMPGIIRYKFATARDLAGSGGGKPETNDEQRQYQVVNDPVFANEPETIILTVQSIGRLQVPMILDRTLTTIKVWLSNFRNGLLDLSRFYNVEKNQLKSFIAEPLTVRVKSYTYPELILQVDNCHGSYLPLIVDSFLRSLVAQAGKQRSETLSNLSERHRLALAQRDSLFERDQKPVALTPLSQEEMKIIRELEQWNRTRQREVDELIEKTPDPMVLRDKLLEYRLQTNFETPPPTTTTSSSPPLSPSKGEGVLPLLKQTVISQQIRHPLRTESYLTLKYPEVLLSQIS